MTEDLTAARFVERLRAKASAEQLAKIQRYFKTEPGDYGEGDLFIGVRMGEVFALAKEFVRMPLTEIELLLDDTAHEVRAGALSIMAKQAVHKETTDERRGALYALYRRRHDRIDNWDLVDLGARDVIGSHLLDRSRDALDELARSPSLWERRTAMLATMAFLRRGELDDVYRIAGLLLHDEHDLIHKPVGGVLREAGKHDRVRLLRFLDEHAATMPRTALRYAIEHLDDAQRAHYRGLARAR